MTTKRMWIPSDGVGGRPERCEIGSTTSRIRHTVHHKASRELLRIVAEATLRITPHRQDDSSTVPSPQAVFRWDPVGRTAVGSIFSMLCQMSHQDGAVFAGRKLDLSPALSRNPTLSADSSEPTSRPESC